MAPRGCANVFNVLSIRSTFQKTGENATEFPSNLLSRLAPKLLYIAITRPRILHDDLAIASMSLMLKAFLLTPGGSIKRTRELSSGAF